MVRTDIPIGNQIAQIGHACLLAGEKFKQPINPSNIVILQTSSEETLYNAMNKITDEGVKLVSFYETEYPLGTAAFCSEPITYEARKTFKKFKLWK